MKGLFGEDQILHKGRAFSNRSGYGGLFDFSDMVVQVSTIGNG